MAGVGRSPCLLVCHSCGVSVPCRRIHSGVPWERLYAEFPMPGFVFNKYPVHEPSVLQLSLRRTSAYSIATFRIWYVSRLILSSSHVSTVAAKRSASIPLKNMGLLRYYLLYLWQAQCTQHKSSQTTGVAAEHSQPLPLRDTRLFYNYLRYRVMSYRVIRGGLRRSFRGYYEHAIFYWSRVNLRALASSGIGIHNELLFGSFTKF